MDVDALALPWIHLPPRQLAVTLIADLLTSGN